MPIFDERLIDCSGARPSSSSEFFIECLPRCFLCMLYSMPNSEIGRRRCGLWSLVSLWVGRYNPFLYLLEEYPVHQGKLNHRDAISCSSGSDDSVFTMAKVLFEGPYALRYP